MHIVLIYQYYLTGGDNQAGGTRWNQMARRFAQSGHQVTVLGGTVNYMTGRADPAYRGRLFVREQDSPGVTVYRCAVSESYNQSWIGRAWAYFSFVYSACACSLRIRRPDLIICTSPPLPVALVGWFLRRRFRKVPMIFEVRDLWPESAIETGVLKGKRAIQLGYALERMAYRESTWINVLTPAFREALIARKNVRPDRISMLPNGADLDIFEPGPRMNAVRERLQIGDRFMVVYAGGLGAANQVLQLVEAARSFDDDARFVIIGDGMHREMLQQKIAAWGLSNVIVTGALPKREVVAYCQAADVCTAVLKNVELFRTVYPNKVFDYMSVGRPVVVAIDGVARELVESAGCGLYAEPENPAALAAAFRRLQADPALGAEMGARGLAFVREHFDRVKIADRYLQLIEKTVMPTASEPAIVPSPSLMRVT